LFVRHKLIPLFRSKLGGILVESFPDWKIAVAVTGWAWWDWLVCLLCWGWG
jgi:hypothetical protein